MKRRILISNDDGIYGLGLKPLIEALRPLGDLEVVVPDGERSAASHSITLHKPFRAQTFPINLSKHSHVDAHITNGTPADCVRFAILKILKDKKVDLVVGGINYGYNLGEDTVYSGTVSVAREASMLGIASFAISVPSDPKIDFSIAGKAARKIAEILLRNRFPSRVFLNVNVPRDADAHTALQISRLGRRIYGKEIPSGIDPRGQEYYWLAGDVPKGIPDVGTDIAAVKAKKISVTPLMVDTTCEFFLPELSGRFREEEYLQQKKKPSKKIR